MKEYYRNEFGTPFSYNTSDSTWAVIDIANSTDPETIAYLDFLDSGGSPLGTDKLTVGQANALEIDATKTRDHDIVNMPGLKMALVAFAIDSEPIPQSIIDLRDSIETSYSARVDAIKDRIV